MLKLARYLKPFAWLLILSIVLLFGQAMCDLNLPNYMSDIVNVGIQQNGVRDAVPEAISQNGFTLITTFMTQDQKETVKDQYSLLGKDNLSSSDFDTYSTKYPLMKDEDVYVLKSTDENTFARLNSIFGETTWTMINFMKDQAAKTGTAGETAPAADTANTDISDVDFTQMYSALPMLQQIPPQAFDSAREQAQKIPESMQIQTGAVMAKEFYTQIGMDIAQIQNNYIVRIGGYMLLISLGGIIAAIIVGYLAAKTAAGVARDLRRDVFAKVESFSNNEFDKFSTSSLITRTTNDITQVQMLIVMGVRMICYSPIIAIGGVIMAVNESVSMVWIIALAVILLIGIMLIVFAFALPKFKKIQKLVDKLNRVMRENLSGLMVIRAFSTQKHEENRFDNVNKELTSTNLAVNRIMVVIFPAMMLIMNTVSLLTVWVGAHQIADSAMQVGDMMAFMQYAMQIIFAFIMLSIMFIMIPRASVSASRIAEVLETEISIKDPKEPRKLGSSIRGELEFKDVSFRYEGAQEDVLSNITFTAKPGATTAFIGSTGSGKTTLINLIPRFYDVTGGQITIDGIDIREMTQHDLRNQIGYVSQKGILFSGTIASNLRYGDENASIEEIEKAARIAQAADFINEKPDKYDDPIAQDATNVSGGQKQRLSIARALVKKPSIYIFDDSFSALDFKTDAALRKALKEQTSNSTVLIVAQRISTIMHADQIIVLDEGKIVGKGTHEELMNSCKTYYEIATSQLSKEELQ
jgi:ATP-binding cassette subfamily B multidrug efflux pump